MNLLDFLDTTVITAEEAGFLTKHSTYSQDMVDDVVVEIMSEIHEATYKRQLSTKVVHEVFARNIGEPIEILVRRAEVICNLKELGFKCETTDKDVEDGTLTISWA